MKKLLLTVALGLLTVFANSSTLTNADFRQPKLVENNDITENLDKNEVQEVRNEVEISRAFWNGGEIRMMNDIAISDSRLTLQHDTTLDLNGCVLKITKKNLGIIGIPTNLKLVLNDSSPTVEHKGTIDETGLWIYDGEGDDIINGGIITGADLSDVERNYNGSAVSCLGAFEMNGGTIAGNRITGSDIGTVSLKESGGPASFTMNDGVISNNVNSNYTAGVYVDDSASFTMNGGKIINNNVIEASGNYSSGIYVTNNDSAITFGGSAYVQDNFIGEKISNFCMCEEGCFEIASHNSSMSIGVTTSTTPSTGNNVPFTSNGSKDDSGCFSSDNEECIVSFNIDHFELIYKGSISNVSLKSAPTKTNYEIGEDLDLTGAALNVTYTDGTVASTPITNSMVSGYDKTKIGDQTLTVTYHGKINTFKVEVKSKVTEIKVKSAPTKTNYEIGEDLDLTGAQITVTREDKSTDDIDVTSSMISGYDKTKVGKQTVTVTYQEKTDTFVVEVKSKVTEIKVKSAPGKTEYKYDEDLDLRGAQITVTREDKSTDDIDVTSSMISGYDKTKVGKQTVTVTYQEKTDTFDVTVVDFTYSIAMKSNPTKVEYKYGEELDIRGAQITITTASGETEDKDVTASMVSGYDSKKIGTQTITVTYEEKTTTFDVTVVDFTSSIVMKSNPTKTKYIVGENLKLKGARITITTASGLAEDKDVTASMVSGYNKNKVGKQTVTVTYEEKKTSFEVTVVDNPTPPTPEDSGLSAGLIAAIVAGSVVALGGLIWLIIVLVKKKNDKKEVKAKTKPVSKATATKAVKPTQKAKPVSKAKTITKKTSKKKK